MKILKVSIRKDEKKKKKETRNKREEEEGRGKERDGNGNRKEAEEEIKSGCKERILGLNRPKVKFYC
jgi:hypothetical protein